MKSEILSQERNVVVVRAAFEAVEVDKAVSATVRELSGKVNIKGFRKGRVPRKTLELYFGRGMIYKETLERVAQEALESVVAEYDLDLIASPSLDAKEMEEGKPYEITYTLEVRPEVTLPDIASLEAEKTIYKVEDSDVDEEFTRLLESNARLELLDEDRPATMEDIVETQYNSYRVKDDGETEELERDQKNTLYLATLRKDFAEAVVGHKLAEEFTFDIKLEDDYPDERMSGAVLRYEMEILRFMKRVVPEATDETVAELTKDKYKTVDELKAEIRSQMEANAADRSEASVRESAIKALSAATEVDVPESMIKRQYDSMRSEQDGQLQRDLKQSLEEYLASNNLNVEEYENNLKKRAEEIVRNTLALDALAERDEISFTSDEINEEIMRIANSMRVNPQQVADVLGKNRDEFTVVVNRVRTRNTVNHLVSLLKVSEVEPAAPAEQDAIDVPVEVIETTEAIEEKEEQE